MTRDDLFKINAGIVRDLVKGIAEYSPGAFILVISNPVNSTVPIAAEVMKQAGTFDPKRLFGVTTLDVVRAETFVQDITGEKDPSKTVIPVIGGHSGETIVPLFSLAKPAVRIPAEKLAPLIKRWSPTSWILRFYLTQVRCPIRRWWGRRGQRGGRIRDSLHGIRRISVRKLMVPFPSHPWLAKVHHLALPRRWSRLLKARAESLSRHSSTYQVSLAAMQSLKKLVLITFLCLSSSEYVYNQYLEKCRVLMLFSPPELRKPPTSSTK